MGVWDYLEEIGTGVSGGEAAYRLLKRARQLEGQTPLNPYRGELIEGLGKFNQSLAIAEHLTEFKPYHDKIKLARETVGKIQYAVAMPGKLDNALATLNEIQELRDAISRIGQIDSRTDPIGAGKAWGAAMKSVGRLAQNLPPPASSLGVLLEDLGDWFHKIVANIVPQEREVWKREIEKHKRGGIDITK